MTLFKCRVIDEYGQRVTIERESFDKETLRAEIKAEKMVLLKAAPIREKIPNAFFALRSRVKTDELIAFYRQFAVMLRAGESISGTLASLLRGRFSSLMQRVLKQVYTDVRSGMLLSAALKKHDDIFPEFFIGMVAIGEASDSLDVVLEDMADYYAREGAIKRKAAAATAYPVVVLGLTAVVTAFLILFVLPRFKSVIEGLGGDIPTVTRIMLGISSFVGQNIIFIAVALLSLVAFIAVFKRTERGKYAFDWLKISVPVFGKLNRAIIATRFCRALTVLLSSGMTVLDAMINISTLFDNEVYKRRLEYTVDEIKRGKRLAPSIGNTLLFPEELVEMIAVGERSGSLKTVLRSSATSFDDRLSATFSRVTALIEPIAIIILGVVVGLVAISVIVPMLSIMQSI